MKPFGRVSRQCTSAICLIALLVTSFVHAFGEETASKRPLTHQDYDSWHSILSPQISRDGKFVAYAYMAQDGDSEIVVRNLTSGAEWRAPRGYRPPAPPPDDSIPNVAELIAANARLVRPAFTADSRFLLFSIEPTKAEVNKAKKAGPGTREGSGNNPAPKEGLKNALGIMDTSTGQIARIERVKSFQVPEDGSGFIAYLLEPKSEPGRGSTRAVAQVAVSGLRWPQSALTYPCCQLVLPQPRHVAGTPHPHRVSTTSMEITAPCPPPRLPRFAFAPRHVSQPY